MAFDLTKQELGKRIKMLREHKGYSQEQIAKMINIQRVSIAMMESGKRSISTIELIKLSRVLEFSLDRLISRNFSIEEKDMAVSTRSANWKINEDKFKNVLLYILEKCGAKPNVGETVLYKLLYFIDFGFYELHKKHLTGATYRKMPYGPVPVEFGGIVKSMISKKQLQTFAMEYHGFPQKKYLPAVKADVSKLPPEEKDAIDRIIEQLSDLTASEISEYSHGDVPWMETNDNVVIDYALVLKREGKYRTKM